MFLDEEVVEGAASDVETPAEEAVEATEEASTGEEIAA